MIKQKYSYYNICIISEQTQSNLQSQILLSLSVLGKSPSQINKCLKRVFFGKKWQEIIHNLFEESLSMAKVSLPFSVKKIIMFNVE